MLLMFGVGLHFSLGDLLAVRASPCPGAVVQMAVATLLGMGPAWWWGWSWARPGLRPVAVGGQHRGAAQGAGVAGVLDTMNGRIAVGWLVVEDLAMVLVLVLLPPLAGCWAAAVRRPAVPSTPAVGGPWARPCCRWAPSSR
jgi:CPA2 family monovalent cation:H+ antiporter-2